MYSPVWPPKAFKQSPQQTPQIVTKRNESIPINCTKGKSKQYRWYRRIVQPLEPGRYELVSRLYNQQTWRRTATTTRDLTGSFSLTRGGGTFPTVTDIASGYNSSISSIDRQQTSLSLTATTTPASDGSTTLRNDHTLAHLHTCSLKEGKTKNSDWVISYQPALATEAFMACAYKMSLI